MALSSLIFRPLSRSAIHEYCLLGLVALVVYRVTYVLALLCKNRSVLVKEILLTTPISCKKIRMTS